MTWLGKILLVAVMVMAVGWMWLTATDFATRVNWKTRSDAYKKGYEEAIDARQKEQAAHQIERDALYRKVESFEKDLIATKAQNDNLARTVKETRDQLDQQSKALTATSTSADKAQAIINGDLKELEKVRSRNIELEDEGVRLRLARDEANRDRLAAQNEARLNRQIAADLSKRNDDLVALVSEFRATGGAPGTAVQRNFDRTVPVPENLRGTVTAYNRAAAPDLVELSIGIDAGLGFGTELDLYRVEGGGKHLGTVVVTNLYEKKAVARFKPASGKPIARLLPDELPKVGDIVSKLSGNGGGLGMRRP